MNQVVNSYLENDHSYQAALFALNDNYADGKDVSWIWDTKLEEAKLDSTAVICSGTRSYDMALRFKYMDLNPSYIEEDQNLAIKELIDLAQGGKGIVVTTYTAMLQIRKILSTMIKLDKIYE